MKDGRIVKKSYPILGQIITTFRWVERLGWDGLNLLLTFLALGIACAHISRGQEERLKHMSVDLSEYFRSKLKCNDI